MKRIVILVLSLVLFSLSGGADNNDYVFRQINSRNGLPDNLVRNMLMLPNGLMCIQTSTMLNLYDGISSKSYSFNPVNIPYSEFAGMNYLFYDSKSHKVWLSQQDYTWNFSLSKREFGYDCRELRDASSEDEHTESFFLMEDGSYWTVSKSGVIRHITGDVTEIIERPAGLKGVLIMQESDDHIYMLSLEGVLAVYDKKIKGFVSLVCNLISDPNSSSRMEMTMASNGDVWILYDRDIIRYVPSRKSVEKFSPIYLPTSDLFTTFAMDSEDKLWIGSSKSGITIFDTKTFSATNLPSIKLDNGIHIDHNTDISKIYIDPYQGVWVATLTEGVFYWHKDIYRISTVSNNNVSGMKFPDEGVKCIAEETDGNILLGTIQGLMRYNPSTGKLSIPYEELNDKLCICLYRDKSDRIWVGTFRDGAYCIDKGHVRHYFYDNMPNVDVSYQEKLPNFNCVRSFYEDNNGNFWIVVYGGLGRFNPRSGSIELLRDKHSVLNRFMLTRGISEVGDSLLVTGDNGSYYYNHKEDRVAFDEEDTFQSMISTSSLVDSRKMLWVASSDGIHIDAPNGEKYHLTTRDGLFSDNTLGLTSDAFGNIWAISFNSISRIIPMLTSESCSFSVNSYDNSDGLSAGAFFQNSLITASDGKIYIGGAHGFSIINPEQMYQHTYERCPIITEMSIFNTPIEVGQEYDGRVILETELSQTKRIVLNPTETFISFSFSYLNYINPRHTAYKYKLEEFDKDWREISSGESNQITYTLLEPGDYVFKVIAADNGTDWSEEGTEIAFTIRPPFWKSNMAYVLYTVLLLAVGVVVYMLMRKKMREKEENRRMDEQRRQKEEVDQMKFVFFTNISHELRTPLSLILLPLENLISRAEENSPAKEQLLTIQRNAKNLLDMVNHLLDFRKLEMKGEKLHLSFANIATFAEEQVKMFMELSKEKEIDLSFENHMTSSEMMFDPKQMHKIINNLLSNAHKFTPKGGTICLRLYQLQGNVMRMEVADNGIGISAADCKQIFNRFYQSSNNSVAQGSGIGLHLVKLYVEMHKGTVGVESKIGKGSTFILEIPMDLKNESEAVQGVEIKNEPVYEDGGELPVEETRNKRILIIDDSKDFRSYMAKTLSETYTVFEAAEGKEGISKALKHHPDIIICDVMMPGIDGFEVCRQLKNNVDTSHIPIILLTARMDNDVRREGYDAGANAYLSKPFSMDVLNSRIINLMEERISRIQKLTTQVDLSPSQIAITPLDKQFIDKMMGIIEKNIDNADYSVEQLASDMAVHRMSLYRKLHSITGKTPSEFLRMMRLKRAAQIIADDPNLSIVVVAEMVGFNSPNYFAKYFKEMFGCNPSQYHKKANE